MSELRMPAKRAIKKIMYVTFNEMIIEIFQSTESTRICLYQKKRYSRCEPTGFFVFYEFLSFFFWNLVDSYLISMSSCLL